MQKTDKVLNEKLLQLGNPKFWGENYLIKVLGGELLKGTLVRVNWTMKYGKMIGHLLLKNNTSEKKVDLCDITDILTETAVISQIPAHAENSTKIPVKIENTPISQTERKKELAAVA
jgi:hypothetical protein